MEEKIILGFRAYSKVYLALVGLIKGLIRSYRSYGAILTVAYMAF
jgi:hypothetical protein